MMYRLIKESFESNNLNSAISKMSKSEKELFTEDLQKIAEKYDQELSSFDDNQVSIVESKDELGPDSEDCLIFNLSDKKWYIKTDGLFMSESVNDYEKIEQIEGDDFKNLPDGTIVIADLRDGGGYGDPAYYVCVKYFCPLDERPFALQNKKQGKECESLFRTIFRSSWVIDRSAYVGSGKIWLVKPKDIRLMSSYKRMSLGEVKKYGLTLKTKDSGEEKKYFIAGYLKGTSSLGEGRLLVFHLDKFNSTGLSSKVSKRGQYDKTTEDEKKAENILRYTKTILDKHEGDEDFIKKYLLGREYKMFFICMGISGYSSLNFGNTQNHIIRFSIDYKKILEKIKEMKSDDLISKRMDKIFEINRLVSDKIDTFDFTDPYDLKAYMYYANLVRNTCRDILGRISDQDFKKIYNSAKNICK